VGDGSKASGSFGSARGGSQRVKFPDSAKVFVFQGGGEQSVSIFMAICLLHAFSRQPQRRERLAKSTARDCAPSITGARTLKSISG